VTAGKCGMMTKCSMQMSCHVPLITADKSLTNKWKDCKGEKSEEWLNSIVMLHCRWLACSKIPNQWELWTIKVF